MATIFGMTATATTEKAWEIGPIFGFCDGNCGNRTQKVIFDLRKKKKKDLRELLVLSYISNVVFGEGFVLLRPFCQLKTFRMTNCPPLDLDDVDEAECKAEFRAKKQHLLRLVWKCCTASSNVYVSSEKRVRRRGGLMHAPEKSVFPCCDMIPQ